MEEEFKKKVAAAANPRNLKVFQDIFLALCPACKRRIIGATQRVNRMSAQDGEKEMARQLELICEECKKKEEEIIKRAENAS